MPPRRWVLVTLGLQPTVVLQRAEVVADEHQTASRENTWQGSGQLTVRSPQAVASWEETLSGQMEGEGTRSARVRVAREPAFPLHVVQTLPQLRYGSLSCVLHGEVTVANGSRNGKPPSALRFGSPGVYGADMDIDATATWLRLWAGRFPAPGMADTRL